jgi:hypothetical protein
MTTDKTPTPFQREERYIVTKIKTGKRVDCVVVEADWPEYEIVWRMIQDRMEGKPPANKTHNDFCNWYQDGDETSETWGTSCGKYFTLNEGTPHENKMFFCCFCGNPLEQNLFEQEADGG